MREQLFRAVKPVTLAHVWCNVRLVDNNRFLSRHLIVCCNELCILLEALTVTRHGTDCRRLPEKREVCQAHV